MANFFGVEVNQHGVPVWLPNNRAAQLAFYRLFFETPVGQQLSPFVEAENDQRQMARILQIHRKWYGKDAEVTLDTFTNVVQSLLATRDPAVIPPEPVVEPEVEVDVPRDRNGKPLTDAQIKWAECTKFSTESSMAEINKRKQSDAGFASFVRKNLEREMAVPIGGAGVVLNARPASPSPTEAPLRLREFAARYLQTPADEVRKLLSSVMNPATYSEYRRDLDAAIAAGLV